jgi:hypothetical protein
MRTFIRTGAWLLGAVLLAAPASAQVVQSLQLGVGAFIPRGYDTRVNGDVLVQDLTDANPLSFDIKHFRSATVFGEWNVAFGPHVEVGGGLGFYTRTTPSVYRDLVNQDNSEIRQDLHLRIVPVTGVVRFLPFGKPGQVQPYVGVGVAVLNWRYSETGQFVDPTDFSIYSARYTATGTTVGPVLLGGIRLPIQGDVFALTAEWRYQFAQGNTGGLNTGFLGDKIDLSGGSALFGLLIRY